FSSSPLHLLTSSEKIPTTLVQVREFLAEQKCLQCEKSLESKGNVYKSTTLTRLTQRRVDLT
ncbi:hypothetical protein L9F63_007597, partial [Diploptera punctata]